MNALRWIFVLAVAVLGACAPSRAAQAPSKGVVPQERNSGTSSNTPDAAKTGGIEGRVIVRFVVDEQGRVHDVKAISGPITLRSACTQAVRRQVFRPALDEKTGKPTSVAKMKVCIFRLKKAATRLDHQPPSHLQRPSPPAKTAYPESARAAGIEGTVSVRYLLDEQGRVAQVLAAHGPKALRAACIDSTLRSQTRPPIDEKTGKPTSVVRMKRCVFKLKEGDSPLAPAAPAVGK